MSSTIGKIFRLTTFGESHGPAIGGVIDGIPSGFKIDFDKINLALERRKPGSSKLYSQRNEKDIPEFLSGIYNGISLGTPIGFIIKNNDHKPDDYKDLKDILRPSHADYTYLKKYGLRDHRGGGRASARETTSWVVAGSIAGQILNKNGIHVNSYVSSIGEIDLDIHYSELNLESTFENDVRCPSSIYAKKMNEKINECIKSGDTLGGKISTIILGLPAGIGEPVFNKLNADIGRVILGINACKAIEFGSGYRGTKNFGSQENDQLYFDSINNSVRSKTNNSGGIQGGISNGMDIFFNSYFKPVSSISTIQESVDINNKNIKFKIDGRHDPCVVPRAVPVVSSVTSIILLDHLLMNKTSKISNL
tara:strand:+ start:1377 stop:2468 length:1092 start_codon:yes stop_codon:yes gene_type:complete